MLLNSAVFSTFGIYMSHGNKFNSAYFRTQIILQNYHAAN
uniref:Uncharacterized protein n=1 Tax=Zea mays TaxID=4577 RepID=B4FZQ4_MAIZE|nr:unknown [Zea mays]ACR37062.1 unknown [Zea mays]